MLVKLKQRLHRAKNIIGRPFRRKKREKLILQEFHVDWEGLKSFNEILNKSSSASGPLKSVVDELWGCIEMFESNQHMATIRSREEYEKLGVDINDLCRVLSKFFDGTSTPPIHEHVAQLGRDIKNAIPAVQGEQPEAGQESEREIGVQVVLVCYRRVRILLARFALTENTRLWKILDENLPARRLDILPHSPAAHYRSVEPSDVRRTRCMPNTRINLLRQLRDWTHHDGGQRIFWLNGLAGTGKTTIAHSFCEQLGNDGKLAASIFCSRHLPACRDFKHILTELSYQLSSVSRPFRCALSDALKNLELRNLPLSDQLARLVTEPLLKVKHTFPPNMVIVVDALDECDDDEAVKEILDVLYRHASDLPAKFFITSRPSPTMLKRMQRKSVEPLLFELRLHEVNRSTVQTDIQTYLVAELGPANLSEPQVEALLLRSGLLFVYAAAMVNHIGHDNFSQSTERLNRILGGSVSSAHESNQDMDIAHATILQIIFDNAALDPSKRDEMTLMLHTLVCAQEPLTAEALAGILNNRTGWVENAPLPLRSGFQVSDTKGLVTTVHELFADYLLDQRRSGEFYCNPMKHHTRIAHACFDLIAMPSPPFNICKLGSSYMRDREVPDIDQRAKEAIAPELLYACRNWGAHVELAGSSEDLLNRLHEFLATRLLLWMEILNISRCMGVAISQLYRIGIWLKGIDGATVIQELAHEAWKFVVTFSLSPMADSTPHIYISMLEFWPEQWLVSKHYMRGTHSLVKVTGNGMRMRGWASLAVLWSDSEIWDVAYSLDGAYIASGSRDCTVRIWDAQTGLPVGQPLEGHTSSVNSVAYSPNGAYIVSGSDDNAIRIWNAQTGQPVGQPLEGHTESVNSVAYFPNGACIISGSSDKTIRIWDAQTGQPVSQPLDGHTSSVNSVAYSPNGAYIVSGSSGKTIRIWDARTGQSVGQPLEGHIGRVKSVAYSPNGAYIVSGSDDRTIRIWDAQTGQPVGQPLEGHISWVMSVAYSPNGAYIVSGSWDKTIRIWDAQTGHAVGQPLEGHTESVNSVAYSPNGAYIVSGSSDRTIRIWDAQTGQPVGEPLGKGHKLLVNSVAYSPNGAYIVSGSSDKTIRIWDAQTGQPVGQPLKGHTDWVKSVAYSPNGAYIVSGSRDKTIRIWDAQTGQPVGEPLGEGHKLLVNSVAYSPNGAYIVSGSLDKTIRIWDARRRGMQRPAATFSSVHSGPSPGSEHLLFHGAQHAPRISEKATNRITEYESHEAGVMLGDWTLNKQGWVVDANQNRLVWVPHGLRDALLRARNTAVISRSGSVRLDFSGAKLGEDWAQCFDPTRLLDVN
ncbi:hypothetical protein FRC08_007247 [Ceratobasidium sp. 394]|nr:hypothetical protein FRC08_007247 [Ceratobasidium sp. 394]